jgi:hypothetical protein
MIASPRDLDGGIPEIRISHGKLDAFRTAVETDADRITESLYRHDALQRNPAILFRTHEDEFLVGEK